MKDVKAEKRSSIFVWLHHKEKYHREETIKKRIVGRIEVKNRHCHLMTREDYLQRAHCGGVRSLRLERRPYMQFSFTYLILKA